MPMIVFRVFLLQKCGKGGRRADGSLVANGADLGQYGGEKGEWGMVVQVGALVCANGVIDGGRRWGPVLSSGTPPDD